MSKGYFKPCKKCGESFDRALMFAAMAEFGGAILSWNPSECPDGQEHDFEWVPPTEDKQEVEGV